MLRETIFSSLEMNEKQNLLIVYFTDHDDKTHEIWLFL